MDLPVFDSRIENFRPREVPELRFEWHPNKRRVYVIDEASPTVGTEIAFEVDNHGAAWNAVLIYLRGYKAGQRTGDEDGQHAQQH